MKRFFQIAVPTVAIAVLMWVWSVSISNNGGWSGTFSPGSVDQLSYNLFKLAGLTAFILVAFQILTGPWMPVWEKLYGTNFYRFHGYEGLVAFLFAVSHWLLIQFYLRLVGMSVPEFNAAYPLPEFLFFYFGPLALVLMTFTVGTALVAVLMNRPRFQRSWRWLHYLNYLVFVLVFLHSRTVGSDVAAGSPLRVLWWGILAGMVAGLFYRVVRYIRTPVPTPVAEVVQAKRAFLVKGE